MNIFRRIKRALCWQLRHAPNGESLGKLGYLPISSRFKKYKCRNCGEYFWQFGESGFIQIHEDDPRLKGLV